ncbi:glutathione S-transferase family protein [Pollutimonas harenae]|uniref:Glutathione S-transferase family protein n=1 Tax=Pollutimonas harenae TaxID=657015 RepID=A0A853GZ91_9BURK|nr:glutathione S-transferase family protein [Pollutimonas harenae]NYT86026.1 glutathione S-transferase family protein [Pollutimonas harenae]TEA71074.1 glutathione S-transferase family protein [Pollutimonas harenae]
MGLLIDGKWHDQWYDTGSTGGNFVRSDTQFRNWITPDGSAGPSGTAGFKAEAGRYHLYVSLACPWASRVLILRALKGLEQMISLSVVNPYMGEHGWTFEPGSGVVADPVGQAQYLYEIYQRAQPNYSGRVTVPLLWDLHGNTIVNNESSEIIRMLNTAFDGIGARKGDYAPVELLPQIDAINAEVYDTVNNGVYKAGFATDQHVYEQEVSQLFAYLDKLELKLGQQRYLVDDRITEADWRLFTTLIRFDAVYHGHFKCNLKRLVDYKNLWSYTRELYQWPGIAATVDFDHIKQHYYRSHGTINPNGIVPAGPLLDLQSPGNRQLAEA